jgi:hypothetical protein
MKSERRQCMELSDQRYPPAPLPLERSCRNRLDKGFGGSRNPRTRVSGSDYELHVSIVLHPVRTEYAEQAAAASS